MGRILLIVNYLFPILFTIFINSFGGGGLTEFKLLLLVLIIFLVLPVVCVILNIAIARLLRLSSHISALILFTGLLLFEVSDHLVWLLHEPVSTSTLDIKTINIIIVKIGYFIFVSLIYYLVKKDENAKPTGAGK